MTATLLRILAIDDDQDARRLLRHMLRQAGHEVTLAGDAEQGLQKLAQSPFDLVISDICLPQLSGLNLLEQIRKRGLDCEVILLTAFPVVDSVIQALREGAADYLTKPITQDVLQSALARVEDKLKERRQRRAPADERYTVGPVTVDPDQFAVEAGGQRVSVTSSEFAILHYLFRHPGRVITPRELVVFIRGYQADPDEASDIIRPHISNLRRKLLEASPEADVIETVRSVGYIVRPMPLPPS